MYKSLVDLVHYEIKCRSNTVKQNKSQARKASAENSQAFDDQNSDEDEMKSTLIDN